MLIFRQNVSQTVASLTAANIELVQSIFLISNASCLSQNSTASKISHSECNPLCLYQRK